MFIRTHNSPENNSEVAKDPKSEEFLSRINVSAIYFKLKKKAPETDFRE